MAQLMYRTALWLVAASAGVVPSSLCLWAAPLVRLHSAPSTYTIFNRSIQHRSAVFSNYDDSGALQRMWTVGIRYARCATTPTGAIRLTVYRIPGARRLPFFLRRFPRGALQYSYPVVEHKRSDNLMWHFTVVPKSTYLYRVDVLGNRPCGYWEIAATSN